MLFNSLGFALFLPVVFALYWFATSRNLKAQNVMLIVASYYFYACWDYRFLFLLIFSTALDYYTGLKVSQSSSRALRLKWLWTSIIVNLGFLGVFKYYNFFVSSFAESVSYLGLSIDPWTLEIILPVGISFYTFHGLSYVIDIYYNRITPERNFIDYGLFVSFFPLLVAGPIERATHLLPQIKKPRVFTYEKGADGCKQILWGLFKKVVIADNCASYVNNVFGNPDAHAGSTIVIAGVLFAVQIYCDFSGYSDIALGTARLFGIELLQNFAFPYFSRDIAEFWRRWHISLSSWFRDYVYIPLGGSKSHKVRNTFIIFILSGFWHGANWTFLVWGLLNAIYFLPLLVTGRNRQNLEIVAINNWLPSLREFFQMTLTFTLTVVAWYFFRAESVSDALGMLSRIFTSTVLQAPQAIKPALVFFLVIFIVIEWSGRRDKYALETLLSSSGRVIRWSGYYALALSIFLFAGEEEQFIYFQF